MSFSSLDELPLPDKISPDMLDEMLHFWSNLSTWRAHAKPGRRVKDIATDHLGTVVGRSSTPGQYLTVRWDSNPTSYKVVPSTTLEV